MNPISNQNVEDVWTEVGGWDPVKAAQEIGQFQKNQPALVTFLFTQTENSEPTVAETGIYLLFLIYRVFEQTYGRPIPAISAQTIVSRHNANVQLVEGLEEAQESSLMREAEFSLSRQPALYQYLTESLYGASAAIDESELSREDSGFLFLLFKTIIEVIDEATSLVPN